MSNIDETTDYYAARAAIYDETAGYTDPVAEQLRAPIKARYRDLFRDKDVLEVACGTGYWTAVIGEVARSVLATDVNAEVLDLARVRCLHLDTVTFQLADAYTLADVPTGFTAAAGIWWWSHIPKGRIGTFLSALHSKLEPGSLVLFNDQLPCAKVTMTEGQDGDMLDRRTLPDGRSFEIIKNFPTEDELRAALHGTAEEIRYDAREEEEHWELIYRRK